jgi:hypothetical protein
MRYREALIDVVSEIVREKKRPREADIRALADRVVEPRDVPKFVEMVSQEFRRLNEFNISRYRLRLSEYWAWFRALEGASAAR